jgi:acetyl esterase/lipase
MDHRTGGNRDRFTQQQIDELATRLRTYTPADLFGETAATAGGQFWTVEDLQRVVQQWYNVQYKYSIMCHLEGLPPMCLLHGNADELSPFSQSIELAEELERSRGPGPICLLHGK